MPRIVVVGAGPAGSSAAFVAAHIRKSEVILLDREAFPRDKTCAGGISARSQSLLSRLNIADAVLGDAHPVSQLRLVGPRGEVFDLSGNRSWVQPRLKLDLALVQQAQSKGATLCENTRVVSLLRHNARVVGVRTDSAEIEADWVIVCAGSNAVPDLLCSSAEPHNLVGLVARYQGDWPEREVQEMHFSQNLLPGYGWVFPESGDFLNAGVFLDTETSGTKVRPIFDQFIAEKVSSRAQLTQVGKVLGHKIACVKSLPRLGEPGVLWAGESAGLASQATGEGIWHALESGIAAAQSIGNDFGRDDSFVISSYQRALSLRLAPFLASSWLFTRFALERAFPFLVSAAHVPAFRGLSRALLERA